jgi:hypothetical protein
MPHYIDQDDLFTSAQPSHFLAPSKSIPRRPSRQSVTNRKSSGPRLAPSSLADALGVAGDDDEGGEGAATNGITNGGGRQHSLAHELAFALMPEPSAGSKLLAEEFGIEYDEGAEGIDEPVDKPARRPGKEMDGQERDEELLEEVQHHALLNGIDEGLDPAGNGLAQGHFYRDQLNGLSNGNVEVQDEEQLKYVNGRGSPLDKRRKPSIKVQRPEADAMDVLAQDLESTENFLKHLRTLDSDSTATSPFSSRSTSSPALERYASDIIRRMDEAARDREGQLRELLEYDREFRKIANEVNGTEVLSRVDELPSLNDDDVDDFSSSTTLVMPTAASSGRTLDTVAEEERTSQNDWNDPHAHLDRDLEDDISPSASISPTPTKTTFSPLPPPPPTPTPSKTTPASTIPHLTHIRTFTSSLISSLTTLSEQAQVNSTATTEAGRKIKSLKNKMGGWQSEWESAEKSRVRIERWEAGIVDWQNGDAVDDATLGSASPARLAARRRVDGRKLVEEFLSASEKAIREATERTQVIMAR